MLIHRPYAPEGGDFLQMWRLLQDDYCQNGSQFIWSTGRLGDWKYGLWHERKFFPTFFAKNAELWLDGFDRLAGFVISEDGEEMFSIFTRAGCEHLYPEILDWTTQHWRPRFPKLTTEVHEGQLAALGWLEARGFRSLGVAAVQREYDLREKAAQGWSLPEGFALQDILTHPDYLGKRTLQKNAFRKEDWVSEVDLLAYEYSRECPIYDPYYDLSVVSAEGVHAASCLAFADIETRQAEVERICAHSQFRRRGLTEAVVRACFQRLYERGFERAYITGYSTEANGLYEKLGPCASKQWFNYTLG